MFIIVCEAGEARQAATISLPHPLLYFTIFLLPPIFFEQLELVVHLLSDFPAENEHGIMSGGVDILDNTVPAAFPPHQKMPF